MYIISGNIEELANSPRDVTNACIRKLGDFNALTDDDLKRVLKNIKNIPAAKIHQLSGDKVNN